MDSQIAANEAISAEDFEIFITELTRIGAIAQRYNCLNAQIAELERAEHPTWHWAPSHQAEADFDSMESYGDINLLYRDRYEEENERYTISRTDLTDPDFEKKAKIRIAELTAARAAEAAVRDEIAMQAAAEQTLEQEAHERALLVQLRAKYEDAETTKEEIR